ncbi:MAG: Phenylacetic acid catabolic protein [Candidatus Thermoplasmatota archaeon]|nr:Phenylacetic acid catabolic protein [Candidatus Thermoplasmatota archaeon]
MVQELAEPQRTDDEVKQAIAAGESLERIEEMSPGYLKALKRLMLVQADTELMSVLCYQPVANTAPTLDTRISASAIVQDEAGHANIMFRLLEDLGEDKEHLVYGRERHEYKNMHFFDYRLNNWYELVVANALFDRAGAVQLGDISHNCSYGPWKRALKKIDIEEKFHLRHGDLWMRRLATGSEATKAKLQAALDRLWPHGVEWFGPENRASTHVQTIIDFGLRSKTNDELRYEWYDDVIPRIKKLGLDLDAHEDAEEASGWHIGYEPDWDEVLTRFKARGPNLDEYLELLRGSHYDIFRNGQAN